MDVVTPERRSAIMSRIRGKNTKPELIVRRLVHAMGYRFRLHRRDLPGSPDLVFPSRHKVVFVHGCFWHRHEGCRKSSMPKTRAEFWAEKFRRNVERDAENYAALEQVGWSHLVIWECETSDLDSLSARLQEFLD